MWHHRVIVLSGYSAYRKTLYDFSKNEQATLFIHLLLLLTAQSTLPQKMVVFMFLMVQTYHFRRHPLSPSPSPSPEPEPFPAIMAAVSIVSIIVIGIGVHFNSKNTKTDTKTNRMGVEPQINGAISCDSIFFIYIPKIQSQEYNKLR